MAEHLVVVQDVAGSSPVAHPIINGIDDYISPFLFPQFQHPIDYTIRNTIAYFGFKLTNSGG